MSRQLKLVGGATAIFLCACVFASRRHAARNRKGTSALEFLTCSCPSIWRIGTRNSRIPIPHVMRVRLGYVKGLSTNFTKMTGEMAVNLQTGAYTTTLSGLTPLTTYAVWLVDRSESDLIPPPPDLLFRLTHVCRRRTHGASVREPWAAGSAAWPHHRPRCRDAWPSRGRRAAGRGDSERLPEDILQALIARECGRRHGPLHRNHTATRLLCARTRSRRRDR